MKRFLTLLALVVALGYSGAIAALKVKEIDLVYHPREREVAPPAAEFALRERNVAYRSADGTKLTAWIVPAPEHDSSGMWLLICHGNLGNIGYGQRPEFYSFMRDLGLNLFAFDYRGFGASEGTPVEEGLYADADASFRYVRDSLGVPPERIILFGHSLGSGVAIDLASRVHAAALIVEGAYTGVVDRGQELYPWLPVKLVASERFPSIEKIGRVGMPKLFLHSPPDDVIPYAHGQKLFAAASEPKTFVSVEGGHENAYKVDREKYYGAIRAMLERVRPRR
jgi:fermentation-respiration switch protein FrsA (DUF1100 family)